MLLKIRSVGVRWSLPLHHGTLSSSGAASSVGFSRPRIRVTQVLIRSQDWFDVLDGENRPVLTEREILRNLQAIITDANDTPPNDVSYLILAGKNSLNVRTGRPQLGRCLVHREQEDVVTSPSRSCQYQTQRSVFGDRRQRSVRRLLG